MNDQIKNVIIVDNGIEFTLPQILADENLRNTWNTVLYERPRILLNADRINDSGRQIKITVSPYFVDLVGPRDQLWDDVLSASL